MNEEPNENDDDQVDEEFVAELINEESSGGETADSSQESSDSSSTADDYDSAVLRTTSKVVYDPSVHVPVQPAEQKQPPSPFENLAAKGGSVGAIVLGVLSFTGSFITSYAILNSFMGIVLGLWGLKSSHRRMALIGIGLCLLSAFFCVVEISAWIQTIWPQDEF